MKGPFDADQYATPLTPEERAALIPTHVTLRSELNELEQKNIAAADGWAFERKRDVTDEAFLKSLHKRMFGDVWKWAGEYRTSDRNLGVKSHEISVAMHQALGNAHTQIEHQAYERDELAVRFHHTLVSIHPFPNGNGRWSRLVGDLTVVELDGERFTWGSTDLRDADEVRAAYVAALKVADQHDFEDLIKFARS